jgi:succinate dehydrogenase/fumarate reductase flavoprotein subunit
MKEEIIEADVLCVGGGIAGLMAAIRAAELGAKVVVADKANTVRSGAGATGNDHFRCYIPEFHGSDFEAVVDETADSQEGWTRNKDYVRTWMSKSFDMVKLWDSWGISMKHDGKWEFAGHAFPGGKFTTLKYHGQNQKPILTSEARKRGVEIKNRVMIVDLLTANNRVIGAVGFDARTEIVYTFKTKCVFLASGDVVRLYPSTTPAYLFNRADPPASTGDGRAMAYRAGVELFNMEMPKRWAGPKYLERCGKATWIGVFKDAQGHPVGPFLTKPDRRYGDVIADAYPTLFEDFAKAGKGPVYMDGQGMSDEDYHYMMEGLTSEGNTALINHMKENGIDVRKNPVEFTTYEFSTRGGINYNARAETSIEGLFAAGDENFGAISNAATFGWIGGENASRYSKTVDLQAGDNTKNQINSIVNNISRLINRQTGITWQEANIALQHLMQDYAGNIRTESLLQAGLTHLKRTREKVNNNLKASNHHELMHCIEVLNLFEIGEIVFQSIIERKETRGKYFRNDYPFTDPRLNHKILICKKANNNLNFEWREIK